MPNVYVNEDLTQVRSALLFKARALKREKRRRPYRCQGQRQQNHDRHQRSRLGSRLPAERSTCRRVISWNLVAAFRQPTSAAAMRPRPSDTMYRFHNLCGKL